MAAAKRSEHCRTIATAAIRSTKKLGGPIFTMSIVERNSLKCPLAIAAESRTNPFVKEWLDGRISCQKAANTVIIEIVLLTFAGSKRPAAELKTRTHHRGTSNHLDHRLPVEDDRLTHEHAPEVLDVILVVHKR
jgi:hypothetical protein